MPKKTAFQIALYKENHYLIEVEASSYEEAESLARLEVDAKSDNELYDYKDATYIIISDVECLDPEWDELSEEETEAI